jgi:peptide/nickel transport system permease protein
LRRFSRDRWAVAGGIAVAAIVLVLFAGPFVAEPLLGHGPNDLFPYAVNQNLQPTGPWSHVPDVHVARTDEYDQPLPPPPGTKQTLLILGGDGALGRDEFLRLLVGGRNSVVVAFCATLLALALGVTLGGSAGLRGGWLDAGVSRLTEFVMAFPLLLFVIMVGSTAADRIDGVTLGGVLDRGMLSLILVIGCFTWFYPARIVRSRVLALREHEFVQAAEMAGAGGWWVLRKHLLPHLVGPLVALASVALATNIMLEAGITFLGVGVKIPATSWGTMLTQTWGSALSPGTFNSATTTIWLTLLPTLAIMLTVLAFNFLAEGVRTALDPVGSQR